MIRCVKTTATPLTLALLFLIGCAQPPTAELAAAEGALAAAKQAGAAEYQPSLADGAEAALELAREAVKAGEYEEARGYIAEATKLANEAAAGVAAAKQGLQNALTGRMTELAAQLPVVEEAVADLEACLKKKRKKVELDAALVRDRLQAISTDLDGVRAAVEAGDDLLALRDADLGEEELERIRDQVDAARMKAGC